MSKKKPELTPAEAERQALEHKVDTMMSVEKTAPMPTKSELKIVSEPMPAKPNKEPEPAPSQATAPELPKPTKTKTKAAKSSIKIVKSEPEPKEPEVETEVPAADVVEAASKDPLEDSDTDKAVDAIVAEEANTQLAVADAAVRLKTAANQDKGPGLLTRFFTNPLTWLFIIGIAAVTWAWFH